jgi:hypothetical protein
MKLELIPIHDTAKSFGHKAIIETTENGSVLFSYNTEVAKIENRKAIVYDTFSDTTLRHIKEYLKQNGYKAETKKQIIADYMEGR